MDTKWFVIDGTLSSGKSVVVRRFRQKGYKMIKEAARAIILEGLRGGKSITEIRGDELSFQQRILAKKIAVENELLSGEVIGFDRGIPSSIAYCRVYGFDSREAIEASFARRYHTVFLMEPLSVKVDYARTDFKIAARLHPIMLGAYKDVGYDPIVVPVFSTDKATSIKERVRFIEGRL